MTDNLLTPENENDQATQSAKSAKPAGLPDKFWDAEAEQIRVDALLTSYLELERKLSSMMPAPDTDEGRTRVLRALGVPETPESYEVDVSHGMFTVDADMNKRFHERGFTPEQVQMVYDLAAEKMVPMILDLADEFKAEREIERLSAAFGGPEKWQEISRQLLAYGRKNLPNDVLENLSSSFEGVMALYRMMKGQEPLMIRESDGNSGGTDEGALRSMMRDPRYWREKDPSFVAKVTDGFQRLYS